MKKIIITESQVKTIITELFDSSNVYDVKLISREKNIAPWDDNLTLTQYRYNFKTKDNLTYRVMLLLGENRTARIDFDVVGVGTNSFIELINKYDSIKVFNTLKSIIEKHKSEIDDLIIHSTEDRNRFYKKLLSYMNIPYDSSDSRMIVAHLNPIEYT